MSTKPGQLQFALWARSALPGWRRRRIPGWVNQQSVSAAHRPLRSRPFEQVAGSISVAPQAANPTSVNTLGSCNAACGRYRHRQ